ncbi:MAG TPA: dithiol-disulfide isomerase [Methylophilaceae bacterium]|nr:dithiol-disulfide isomerase [Methylophilaceae bacterium]
MSDQSNNPLLCDIETGICAIPDNEISAEGTQTPTQTKTIQLIYFTDPICSSCWGIEPQLRKLKLEYGHVVDIQYKMGGLLPDWSYNSGGISKPADVAHHWDEVSVYYDMPIDGDLWLEDPLASSFPPSIAFKAAEMQDHIKAIAFLRKLKELVFIQKKNIAKWEQIEVAALAIGLNIDQLKQGYTGEANQLFSADLALAKQWGVRGFPTMFFMHESGKQEIVYGARPYSTFEKAIQTLDSRIKPNTYEANWENLFSIYPTLTAREFAELSGMPRNQVDAFLQVLSDKGSLSKIATKNGALWYVTV